MERLDKILANMGYGTRKEVKKLIKNGAVKIDDVPASSPEQKIDPERNRLTVFDSPVEYREFIYLMLNKPQDYVSATQDNRYNTVLDLVPDQYLHYQPFPVGRLDIDTEGLIILTNDGKLAHNALSPKKHIEKVYYAEVERPVTQQDIDHFAAGMDLGDFIAKPAKLELTDGGCLVTICEGKFHQVKRMFEKTGNRVTYLKRIQMGGITLDEDLALGEIREISDEEIQKLWK